jgi:Tol biopolymer transport system component/C-terminal processing protease CtpA/Prc
MLYDSRMNRTLLALLVAAVCAHAQGARWMRDSAISPDGKWIVFSYKGDLWRVSAEGGDAVPVTRHVGYDRAPVWSPDGRSLAFASDRHGNFDVFLVDAAGGDERRLTFHSTHDVPTDFTPDGKEVLFQSTRLDAPAANLGSPWFDELYAIATTGGRPRQVLTTPTHRARYSPDGKTIAYQDFKGWEQAWRKHHVSPVTRDITLYRDGVHSRITKNRAEDRNPVWAKGGKAIYFLSERGGNYNVWRIAAPFSGEPVQVTFHPTHPSRFLSIGGDDTLCYVYNGDLFVKRGDAEPRKLVVNARGGVQRNDKLALTMRSGATGFAVAPNEKEIAFVARGEVFVASVKHGTTKRITSTPSQERSVAFSPDSKTLYYAAERNGSWSLYRTTRVRADEPYFFVSTALKEEPVLATDDDAFQPVVSPDGKKIAYLLNRDEIRVLDLKSGESRTMVPADVNYSYSDGDLEYAWSPDSRFLAATYIPRGRRIDSIAVVEVATGKLTDMTLSGYYEWGPKWSHAGDALLFVSDRFGRRSHGSWGSDNDIFAMYLTREAHRRARLGEEDLALEKEAEEEREKKKKKKAKKKDEKAKEPAKEEKNKDDKPKPVEIEFESRERRVRRLTLHSAPIGGYDLSPDGETLVYFARVDDRWDLWEHKIRKAETKRLRTMDARRAGEVVFSAKGDAVFVRGFDGAIQRIPLKGNGKRVAYAAEMTVDLPAERRYIFEHVWRQTRAKFYDPKLHGVDWNLMRENYGAFLEHIDNNHDFARMLSELSGELNASHTRSSYRIPQDNADVTSALGLLFDPAHRGNGLKVAEVLKGGPFDRKDLGVAPGAMLMSVDGVRLSPSVNYAAQLNRKEGKRVLLGFVSPDNKGFDVVIKPITTGAENELRYRRWLDRCRALVEEASGGRLGYVHVRGMNDRSFRHLFQEALGRHRGRAGLVVDTRFNGGGWAHDDLVKFFTGRQYAMYHPRGKERGSQGGEPLHRWAKPVVVVQNETNYSDAHVFPWAFKELKLGKLVGAPVAGTGTAVWWERQIDPTINYGIPQMGFVTMGGRYLENYELKPDIEVYNDAASKARGEDKQLEAAVKVLLDEIDE